MIVSELSTILSIALALCTCVVMALAWLVVEASDAHSAARPRARMASKRPARKVNVAAAVGGAVVLAAWALRTWTGVDLSVEAETVIVSAMVWLAGYFVPPSWRDAVELKAPHGDA